MSADRGKWRRAGFPPLKALAFHRIKSPDAVVVTETQPLGLTMFGALNGAARATGPVSGAAHERYQATARAAGLPVARVRVEARKWREKDVRERTWSRKDLILWDSQLFVAVPLLGAARATMLSNIEPLLGGIEFAMIVLNERVTCVQAMGMILVFLSIGIMELAPRRG